MCCMLALSVERTASPALNTFLTIVSERHGERGKKVSRGQFPSTILPKPRRHLWDSALGKMHVKDLSPRNVSDHRLERSSIGTNSTVCPLALCLTYPFKFNAQYEPRPWAPV